MDDWVDPRQPYRGRKSLYREQYNALGKRTLAASRVRWRQVRSSF
jgi:hypothetical protein